MDDEKIEEIKIRIRKFIEDRASLEVITARGDITIDFKEMKKEENMLTFIKRLEVKDGKIQVLARTRIELDGDILSILPSKNTGSSFELDEKVLKIHNDTVSAGIERWENYMNSILHIINLITDTTLANLFGKTESKPEPKKS